MPLNKLENFIKNTEGRILYVNPSDLDSTDSITNQGNSLTKPFKTIQRALLESARFSYQSGLDNDKTDQTTILVFPGEHVIDNRPGFAIKPDPTDSTRALSVAPAGAEELAVATFGLGLTSEFDLTVENNVLYKFNSVNGGVIVPRGTSIVGLDLRKTKIRPLYVPNPTDDDVPYSAIFRITGNCYFWQFSIFDGQQEGLVYTDHQQFNDLNQSKPTFSHHKLTCFEYADGVNEVKGYNATDLSMYYYKLTYAYQEPTGRAVNFEWPNSEGDFDKVRPEYEIVGALGTDPFVITQIISGDGLTPTSQITVTTQTPHDLTAGTPIKISGVNVTQYNISTLVQSVISETQFTYLLPNFPNNLPATPTNITEARVTIESDTVTGSSPYIFNISLRSVYGMNGMLADGNKATGFRSMVVAQFTAISLQKDDRAFAKYNRETRLYESIAYDTVSGAELAAESSSTDPSTVYHLDSGAIYRSGWEQSHITISNNAIVQIVSVFAIGFNGHFVGKSGADASITNSNSNFGQYSLIADGFRNEAFPRDDQGYITHFVAPQWVSTYADEDLDNISWFQIDVPKTQQVGLSSHLYLSGFTREDVTPLGLTQGYRIGANLNENLYVSIGGTEYSAPVYMAENVIAGVQTAIVGDIHGTKFSTASAPNTDFEITVQDIGFINGETIRVFSDDGDLPEGLAPNTVYYCIKLSGTQIKIASTFSNAVNGIPIAIYGGSKLRIESRVSDKNPNDIGHPVQYDPNQNNWFIHCGTNNDLYTQVVLNDYIKNEVETDPTYFKRYEDRRSIENKLYKIRYVIPKEADNARDPVDGFIIQRSGQTGFAKTSDITATTITANDNNFRRNYGFIATCSEVSDTVTVRAELPHGVTVGDVIYVENVLDSNNTAGLDQQGYNGYFTVTSVPNSMEFRYSNTDIFGDKKNTGNFIDNTADRSLFLPRFSVNDNKGNFDIYRSTVITPYVRNESDGVYLLEVLASDYAPPTEFTSQKYSQQITDFYPQLDRDNIRKNPPAAVSFARRDPVGRVDTNSLLNSVTREAIDKFSKKFGVGIAVSSVTAVSAGVATIQLSDQHNLNGIITYENLQPVGTGAGFATTDKYNVRLLDSFGAWNGATARVRVGVGSTVITSLTIQAPGSGYQGGETLFPENFSGASIGVPTTGLINNHDDTVQITGIGTTAGGYYRVVGVPAKDKVAIAITAGEPKLVHGQYLFRIAPSVSVGSTHYDSTTGLTTFTTLTPHGIRQGSQFTLVDDSDNKVGDFYVLSVDSVEEFQAKTVFDVGFTTAFKILPHAFSDHQQSVSINEAIGSRYFNLYAGDHAVVKTAVTNTDTLIPVQHQTGIATDLRFKLGDYLEIDEEIVRVSAQGLVGSGNDSLTVLRGQLGTVPKAHTPHAPIKKLNIMAVETRRPSILRASGHTFEYLGYGPGNYSTALPQVQNRTLSQVEEYLSQAQERSCGTVVYTGLNNEGDFYIGNKKISSASGQESSFNIPIPTITGEDPSANSVVFDEVTIKQRLNVEGGEQQNILSQFDGPVTFTNDVSLTGNVVSTGNIELAGTIEFSGSFPSGAKLNCVRAGVGTNGTEITTDPGCGDLVLNAATGFSVAIATATSYNAEVTFREQVNFLGFTTFSGDIYVAGTGFTYCGGPLHVCDDIVAFYGSSSDENLKENIALLDKPLDKVMQIRGTQYDWKEGHKSFKGHDIGVIAQDVEKVLPEAVSTKPDGTKGVHYNKLIPLLIEAVKDLSKQVDDLKDK